MQRCKDERCNFALCEVYVISTFEMEMCSTRGHLCVDDWTDANECTYPIGDDYGVVWLKVNFIVIGEEIYLSFSLVGCDSDRQYVSNLP